MKNDDQLRTELARKELVLAKMRYRVLSIGPNEGVNRLQALLTLGAAIDALEALLRRLENGH